MSMEFVELDKGEEAALERYAAGSELFADLLEAYGKYGHLTQKQYACLERQIDKDEAR